MSGTCTGTAGAACCAHASPGACIEDGFCSACRPDGGRGHTFLLRSKNRPSLYLQPETSASNNVALWLANYTGADDSDAARGAAMGFSMIERHDASSVLLPYTNNVPNGAMVLRHTSGAGLIARAANGGGAGGIANGEALKLYAVPKVRWPRAAARRVV